VKLACDQLRATKSSSTNLISSSPGQLRHLTQDLFEDAVDTTDRIETVVSQDNDTNEDGLLYYAHLTNHYLRLAKASLKTLPISRYTVQFPVIADSGANFHMFKECEFFTKLTPAMGKVILADGKTVLPIQGVGTVKCLVDGHELTINNVRYISDLSESLYSLFLHIQHPRQGVHSSFEKGLFLTFPNFTTKALIGDHDIYIDMVPLQSLQVGISSSSSLCGIDQLIDFPQRNICHHIKNFQSDLQVETDYLDNLLSDLRNYYKTIKTRHQLNLEVPAGFRESSNHVKQIHHYLSMMHSDSLDHPVDPLISSSSSNIIDDSNVIVDTITDTNESSPTIDIPIIRSID
jgi:hypothetical protein